MERFIGVDTNRSKEPIAVFEVDDFSISLGRVISTKRKTYAESRSLLIMFENYKKYKSNPTEIKKAIDAVFVAKLSM